MTYRNGEGKRKENDMAEKGQHQAPRDKDHEKQTCSSPQGLRKAERMRGNRHLEKWGAGNGLLENLYKRHVDPVITKLDNGPP